VLLVAAAHRWSLNRERSFRHVRTTMADRALLATTERGTYARVLNRSSVGPFSWE